MTDVTSEPSLDRRVRRLENETESIYELIGDIRSTQQLHTQRLDTIDTRLDGWRHGWTESRPSSWGSVSPCRRLFADSLTRMADGNVDRTLR